MKTFSLSLRNTENLKPAPYAAFIFKKGIRVAEFSKITRDIPKRVVLAGIEVGFTISGQPATCYRCQSKEHVVKDCPTRPCAPPRWDENSRPEGEAPGTNTSSDGDLPGEGMDTSTPPSLFTQPETASYASVAAGVDDTTTDQETADDLRVWALRKECEDDEAVQALRASRSRKRDNPSLWEQR